jgi:hypothetical protein
LNETSEGEAVTANVGTEVPTSTRNVKSVEPKNVGEGPGGKHTQAKSKDVPENLPSSSSSSSSLPSQVVNVPLTGEQYRDFRAWTAAKETAETPRYVEPSIENTIAMCLEEESVEDPREFPRERDVRAEEAAIRAEQETREATFATSSVRHNKRERSRSRSRSKSPKGDDFFKRQKGNRRERSQSPEVSRHVLGTSLKFPSTYSFLQW